MPDDRVAVRRRRHSVSARRRPRSDRAADGGRRWSCRAVRYRRRSVAVLPDAARRRTTWCRADSVAGNGGTDDFAVHTAALRDVRGLGWDIDSSYSANRGELFPIGSFGHTGFTGTSLWLDPATKSYVVFLSNRVHPDGKGDVTALRGKVATVAAAALMYCRRRGGSSTGTC